MLDFNTEPYNDDFDENNKFYRILFRPSFAVQARELTQMQSILQNQIKKHGDSIFKQGAMVIPGQISVDTKYAYVKLQDYYGSSVTETYVDNLLGSTLTGRTSGVQATVLKVVHAEGTDPTTIYVRYLDSGTSNTEKAFTDNEILEDGVNTPVQAITSNATGYGSAAIIQRGVYYVNGYFVLCDEQTIILDKYTNIPSYRVGLIVDEQKIAPETTYVSKSTGVSVSYDMLLDNAQNSYNYAAPGAHRYYIDLVLTKIPLYSSAQKWLPSSSYAAGSLIKNGTLYYLVTVNGTTGTTAPVHTQGSASNGDATLQYVATYDAASDTTSDANFIELISTLRGTTQRAVTTTAYSEIEKTLARRTFDESGNYTVKPFNIDVREHRNNDRGSWQKNTTYEVGDIVTNNGYTYYAHRSGSGGVPGTSGNVGNGPGYSTTPDNPGLDIVDNTVTWRYTTKPIYNRGIYQDGDSSKLAVGMEPGKAYVSGYEIEKIVTEYVPISKARTTLQTVDSYTQAPVGNYVLVTNMNSLPPMDSTLGLDRVNIYDRVTSSAGSAPTTTTGTIATGNVNTSTEAITVSNHGLATGDQITYSNAGGTSIAGLTSGTTYYAIRVDANTFKVASTYADANNGNAINLTGTGNSSQYFTIGNLIGTARVKAVTFDSGTVGLTSAVYKMYLFDVKMTTGYDFARDAKSFFYTRTGPDFSADISPVVTSLDGSATTYTTYPTKGSSVTLTGIGTSWSAGNVKTNSPALTVGDYIYIGNPVTGGVRRRVVNVNGEGSITVDSSVTADGSVIYLVKTNAVEPSNSKMIFPLPNTGIASVRDAVGDKAIVYYITQYNSGTTSAPTGTPGNPGAYCTLTLTTGSGVFASPDEIDNFVIVPNYAGAPSNTPLKPLSDPAITVGGSTTITFKIDCSTYDYSGGKDFIAVTTVKKTGVNSGTEKTKQLKSSTEMSKDALFTTQSAATAPTLSLGTADVYRVISVMMKPGTWGAEGSDYTIDISDRYDLDNGQRDTHYDIAKLVLKQSYAPPTASVKVVFDFFVHGQGDYFSKNSYNEDEIRYENIPSYGSYSLRDVLDFRPRIGDGGILFSGTGAVFANPPKRGTDITVDYSYYLPRKDKIAVDSYGQFYQVPGVPSNAPSLPADPELGMVLYGLTLLPYTNNTDSVIAEQVDNKRYTMRDIGKLEKRISNLEYYTTLSMAEQDTKQLSIKDSTGLDRFKNGFIVDSFTGHNVGNVLSPDYVCSIDMQNQELRPTVLPRNVNLVETLSSDADRLNQGYKLYGDVITLPVVDEPIMIQQPYGSRIENINPFAVFTFLGDVRMNPSSDDWFEDKYDSKIDITRNIEGNYQNFYNLNGGKTISYIFNAWQTTWTGQPTFTSATLVSGSQDVLNYAISIGQGATGGNFSLNGGWGRYWGGYTAIAKGTADARQTRTGVKNTVVEQIDTQVVDDKVISTTVIPYIRSRNILIQSKKLKPNTKFYPFFDNIDVSAHCTAATKITYELTSTQDFDTTTNAGSSSNEASRVIKPGVNGYVWNDTTGTMALNIGDVIRGSTSGTTAVVVGVDQEFANDGTYTRHLYVLNIQGTSRFILDETIVGSISQATGKIKSVPVATGSDAFGTLGNQPIGGSLITNYKGDVAFLFHLPNTDALRYRCGLREFKLVDVSNPALAGTSSAKIQYESTGIINNRQRTINSVRNAKIIQEPISTVGPEGELLKQTITTTIERTISGNGYYDPLAQTFLVQQKGGAFLSKVDIFFATKDSNLPVTLELREVVNGYPGQRVLPFSKVTLDPKQVNLSSNTVQLTDGSNATVKKYDTPTSFRFPSPVYVQENQEYALVLSSDSNNYKAWISQMGDLIPGSSRTISEQPYLGSLFKSQNATTWTAAQDQDLMFTIYRCKFDTQVVGAVQFANDTLLPNVIDNDPFEVVQGKSLIRVWHRDHGLFPGSYVEFDNQDTSVYTGIQGTGTISVASTTGTTVTGSGTAFINDIPSAGTVLFRKSDGKYLGVVDHVTDNTHLTLRSNCTTDISTPTEFMYADSLNGIPVTEIYRDANNTSPLTLTVVATDLDSYTVQCTTAGTATGYCGGSSVVATGNVLYDIIQPSAQYQNFTETSCNWGIKTTTGKSVDGSEVPYSTDADFATVTANDNNFFASPRVVASPKNKVSPTLVLKANLSTTNDALTPVIDTHRLSVIAISNKINAPTETNVNISDLDNRAVFNAYTYNSSTNPTGGTFSFSGYTITTTNSVIAALMQSFAIGKYITITNATTSGNNGTYLVTGLTGDGSTTGTITVSRTTPFTSEAAATGSSSSTATNVYQRVLFVDDIAPVGSTSINKYVSKVIELANPSTFINVRYAVNCPTDANVLVYYKTGNTSDFVDGKWTLANPDAAIQKVKNGDGTFYDVSHSVSGVAAFNKMMVKVVMQSTNSSAVPRIKELRIIACA